MVNIFGMKFFESPSMEEQMHYKGRSHGPNCGCPICVKKRHKTSSRRRFISRRRLRGGYTYKQNNKSIKEEDVTMELSNILSGSKSSSKSMSKNKSKARGTRRRNH
jgi:hypothetical protein